MEHTWYWRRRHRGGEEDRDELDGEVHGETEDKRGVSVAVTSYTALHSAPTDRWRSSPNCPDSHLAGSPPQLWSERWRDRDRQGGTGEIIPTRIISDGASHQRERERERET